MDDFSFLTEMKISRLIESAYKAYCSQHYRPALQLYSEALVNALSIKHEGYITHIRLWKCICLQMEGKYRLALAESLDAIRSKSGQAFHGDVFKLYSEVISIVSLIPLEMRLIKDAIAKAGQYIKTNGEPAWRSVILYEEAALLSLRGKLSEAFDKALEALAYYNGEYPSFIIDSHYHQIVDICLKMKDKKAANEYLEEWDKANNNYPDARKRSILHSKIQYARFSGNRKEAFVLARQHSLLLNNVADSFHLVTVYMINGYLDSAYEPLVNYLYSQKNAESLFTQSYCFTICGKYHYSKTRKMLNLDIVDMKYDDEDSVSPPRNINRELNMRRLKKEVANATRMFRHALNISNQINEIHENKSNIDFDEKCLRLAIKLESAINELYGSVQCSDFDTGIR